MAFTEPEVYKEDEVFDESSDEEGDLLSFFEGERIITEARQRGQAPQAERQEEPQENDQVCMKFS